VHNVEVTAVPTGRQRHPRWRVLTGVGATVGLALAVVWSARFVDGVIGEGVASALLGSEVREAAIASGAAGMLFALVTGLAGSFTACNIAVLGAAPQLASSAAGRRACPPSFPTRTAAADRAGS
jgi:hypothetical protein